MKNDFLEVMMAAGQKGKSGGMRFEYGTIPAEYSEGLPTLILDGESSAGTRTYPYLSSYTPAAGDRVLVLYVRSSAVIIGNIVTS